MNSIRTSLVSRNVFALLSLTAVFTPGRSHAAFGKEGGNGGNAYVCFDNEAIVTRLTAASSGSIAKVIPGGPGGDLEHIVSIEALDLRNARRAEGFPSREPVLYAYGDAASPEAYVERVVNRYDTPWSFEGVWKSAPQMKISDVLRAGEKIIRSVQTVHDQALLPVDDFAPITKAGSKCVYATMMVQQRTSSGRTKLTIDGRLYEHGSHSNLSRAVFQLHERALAVLIEDESVTIESTNPLQHLVAALFRKDLSADEMAARLNEAYALGDAGRGRRVFGPQVDERNFFRPVLGSPGIDRALYEELAYARELAFSEPKRLLEGFLESPRVMEILRTLPRKCADEYRARLTDSGGREGTPVSCSKTARWVNTYAELTILKRTHDERAVRPAIEKALRDRTDQRQAALDRILLELTPYAGEELKEKLFLFGVRFAEWVRTGAVDDLPVADPLGITVSEYGRLRVDASSMRF